MPSNMASGAYGFRVSPRVLAPLGLEQLPDPALAVLELVKNSWDANATAVTIEIDQRRSNPTITVTDNGTGMSRDDFRDRWLVIGASHKRGRAQGRRPLIGEKGLGRLASYALGSTLNVKSATATTAGFQAEVDWDAFFQAPSVDKYEIRLKRITLPRGTTVTIGKLRSQWSERHTEFLSTYTQFLTAVPGEKFRVTLKVDGVRQVLRDPLEAIAKIAEAELKMKVQSDGTPVITSCTVDGKDYSWVPFRNFKARLKDPRLAETSLSLKFYRRDKAVRRLTEVLQSRDVNELLEKYQGVRIYRNGINVPPYGLTGNDWAALEKQRTSTGGPTMVPGNTQLVGELRVPAARHLTITAGRSGFSDQDAVAGLAEYVRWAVKELGTARRAHDLGIEDGPVPSRVDVDGKRSEASVEKRARKALAEISRSSAIRQDPELLKEFERVRGDIEGVLDRNEATLRLYAQLASTGIAATSFAHELRTDFDVVSSAVREIVKKQHVPDEELKGLLVGSWGRIKNFVALFRLLPIKVRRSRTDMNQKALQASVSGIFKLVPTDTIVVTSSVSSVRAALVPADLDSILLNLVSNSVKAIAESSQAKSGKIHVDIDARGSDMHVSVFDNGCGIPDSVKNVMFEPLEGKFSEGTGMGLAIVRFIAERYKGGISATNTAKRGFTTQMRATLKGVVR